MSLLHKLQPVLARFDELSALMAEGGVSGDRYTAMAREYADLEPVVDTVRAYERALAEQEGLKTLLSDPDFRDEAQKEWDQLLKTIPHLEDAIKRALIPKDATDARNAILEIRAGTGGDEAALFAGDLLVMYRGYAAQMGWRFEMIEASESELGGYREVICEINGVNVFERLKFESGVHRVQRVPKTEASGRIHTSAATVAVLPEAEEVDITINEADLRVDTYRAQGAGGQHVNKTESAIRITHIPSGLAVAVQEEKSQHKNRAKAMKLLRSRLFEIQYQKLAAERAQNRKSQVGSGDRSERIRTYNFPQGRVTDHRINLTLYNLDNVLNGSDLSEIIDALLAHDQAEKLADLNM